MHFELIHIIFQQEESKTKYIPRLNPLCPNSLESENISPLDWDKTDVAQFLQINECGAYCETFTEQNVDGGRLLSLTKDQIIDLTGFKVGPSLKIFDLIQQLKSKINIARKRLTHT